MSRRRSSINSTKMRATTGGAAVRAPWSPSFTIPRGYCDSRVASRRPVHGAETTWKYAAWSPPETVSSAALRSLEWSHSSSTSSEVPKSDPASFACFGRGRARAFPSLEGEMNHVESVRGLPGRLRHAGKAAARTCEGEYRDAGSELLTVAVAPLDGVVFQASQLVYEVLSAVQRSRAEEVELELRRPLTSFNHCPAPSTTR